MSTTASALAQTIRDLVPDPTYDSAGVFLPNADGGLVRAQTLYNLINDGVRATIRQIGWELVDWYAFPSVANQAWYSLDSKWVGLDQAFANKWRLVFADEQYTVWPLNTATSQPLWFFTHLSTDHWEIGFFPNTNTTDPTTTLDGTINSSVTTINVVSTSGFLPQGYIQVGSEIIAYGAYSGNTLQACRRGQCATTAASHTNGDTVTHLSLWVKGRRAAADITTGSSVVEVPTVFQYPIQLYVLSRIQTMQQESGEAKRLIDEFFQECARVKADPSWRIHQSVQGLAYGEAVMGPLAFGRVVVPVLSMITTLYGVLTCFQ